MRNWGEKKKIRKRPRYTSGPFQKALIRRKTEHLAALWCNYCLSLNYKVKTFPFPETPSPSSGCDPEVQKHHPTAKKSPPTRQVVRKHNFALPSLGLTLGNPRSDWALPRPGASHQVSVCDSKCRHWRLASRSCYS